MLYISTHVMFIVDSHTHTAQCDVFVVYTTIRLCLYTIYIYAVLFKNDNVSSSYALAIEAIKR